jgi:HK97 family phage prohead protease
VAALVVSVIPETVSPLIVQSVWHKATLYSREEAANWCDSHNFKSSVYRSRSIEGETTHHIHAQFDTSEAVEGSWAILSDDFPDGISVSICERKNMGIHHTKGVQSENDPFEFVMSDESVDRVGDVIRAGGWDLADFQKNPVALWGHDHGKPIGVWENVRINGKKLIGKLKLAKEGTSAEIDTIRSLVEQRILKAVSVGFQPLEAKPLEKSSGYEYTKQRLHECSLVAVPANANALAIAKSFGADPAKVFYGDIRQPSKCASVVTQEKMALLDSAINRNTDFLEKRK